jgi:hypothetical protein
MFQPVDLEEALRNNQPMGEFLLDREECRFAKPGRIKTSKTVTLNWDDNF